MRVIVDTNFFIDLLRFRIGLDELGILADSHRLETIDLVLEELNGLAKKSGVDGRHAKAALKLVELEGIVGIKTGGRNTDTELVKLAKQSKEIIVATDDAKLRERIKKLGNRTIYLRAKKHLAIS